MIHKARWVFPQIHASTLLPPIVREIGHLRWQEEINEFKLANQHFDIKHILHHEQNSIQIFLFLKLFVSAAILQPSLSIHFWVRESVKGESQASVPQPGDARVNASAFDYVYAVEAQGQGPSHVKSE